MRPALSPGTWGINGFASVLSAALVIRDRQGQTGPDTFLDFSGGFCDTPNTRRFRTATTPNIQAGFINIC